MAAFPRGALTPPGSSPVYPSTSLSPSSPPSSPPAGPPTPDSVHTVLPSSTTTTTTNPVYSPNPVSVHSDNISRSGGSHATSEAQVPAYLDCSSSVAPNSAPSTRHPPGACAHPTNENCSSDEWAESPNCGEPSSGSQLLGPKDEVGVCVFSSAGAVK